MINTQGWLVTVLCEDQNFDQLCVNTKKSDELIYFVHMKYIGCSELRTPGLVRFPKPIAFGSQSCCTPKLWYIGKVGHQWRCVQPCIVHNRRCSQWKMANSQCVHFTHCKLCTDMRTYFEDSVVNINGARQGQYSVGSPRIQCISSFNTVHFESPRSQCTRQRDSAQCTGKHHDGSAAVNTNFAQDHKTTSTHP